MLINRNNYEIFIIDYYDGRLNPVQTAELMFFLSQNPDLEKEFMAFENIELPADKQYFSQKECLKKNYNDIPAITGMNFDEFCVAAMEGELDKASKIRFLKYLENNPGKKKEFELYNKTILKPDLNLLFPHSDRLKKHKIIPLKFSKLLFYAGISAAAVLVVLLTLLFYKNPAPDLISVKKPEIKTVKGIEPAEKVAVKGKSPDNRSGHEKIQAGSMTQKTHPLESFKNIPARKSEISHKISVQKIKSIEVQKIENLHLAGNQVLSINNKFNVSKNISHQANQEKSITEFIRENILKKEISKSIEDLNAWSIAQASIKGINYLTESDVQIDKKLDKNGKISEFLIESESFSFSTPLKKHPVQ